jgi:hypothetical protein
VQPRLLVAVLVVERHVHLDRLVAVGAEVVQRRLQRRVEAAPDLAGPAHQQHQLLLVEADAQLVGFQALHVGERVRVEILEPGRQRLLDLLAGDPFEDGDVGVHVDFEPHETKPHRTGVQFITRGRQLCGGSGVE